MRNFLCWLGLHRAEGPHHLAFGPQGCRYHCAHCKRVMVFEGERDQPWITWRNVFWDEKQKAEVCWG